MNRATPLVLAALLVLSGLFFVPAAQASPAIASVSPTTGSANGGTVLNITGGGFVAGAVVQFVTTVGNTVVSTTLTAIQVTSTRITATTPAHDPGSVQVRVTNPDGSSALTGTSFTYTQATLPAASTVAPTSGPSNGGTTLIISGAAFSTGLKPQVVLVASSPADVAGKIIPLTVQSVTATSITAVTSGSAVNVFGVLKQVSSGFIQVINPDGSSSTLSQPFTYVSQPSPSLSSLTPLTGSANGGTVLTLTGSNFWPGAQVFFKPAVGDTVPAASVGFISATQLRVVSPVQTSSATPEAVVVINPDGQGGSTPLASSYTVQAGPTGSATPAPSDSMKVTAILPVVGPSSGGTPVTVQGIGFVRGATLAVAFGANPATDVKFVDSSHVTAVVPACSGCTGLTSVTVTNPDGGSAHNNGIFRYTNQVVITGINPVTVDTSGSPTQPITISGHGFTTVCQVFVAGLPATITGTGQCTESGVTVIPPPGVAGTKDVQVVDNDGRTATLQGALGYKLPPVPSLSAPSPTAVKSNGGTVAVNGAGFIPVKGTGILANTCVWPIVKFNGQQAVVTACTTTQLTVLVPAIDASTIPANSAKGSPLGPCDANPASDHSTDCLPSDISITNIDGQTATRGALTSSGHFQFKYTRSPPPHVRQADDPGTPESSDDIFAGCGPCFRSVTDGGTKMTAFGHDFAFGVLVPGLGRIGATTFLVGTVPAVIDESFNPPWDVIPADPTVGDDGGIMWHLIAPAQKAGGSISLVATNPDKQADSALTDYVAYSKPGVPALQQNANNIGSANGNTPTTLNAAQGTLGAGATIFFDKTPVTLEWPFLCNQNSVVDNCVSGGGAPGTAGNIIKIRPPGHAPGKVPIKIVNLDGQTFTLTDGYTYQAEPAPVVTSVSPATAPGIGGNTVMIAGFGFARGSQDGDQDGITLPLLLNLTYLKPIVTLSNEAGTTIVPSSNIKVVNGGTTVGSGPTAAICPGTASSNPCVQLLLPDHAPGIVDIRVQNPDGQSSLLQNAFTYLGTQTNIHLSPSFGTQNGGTFVGFSGIGFDVRATAPAILFDTDGTTAGIRSASGVATASSTLAVGTSPGAAASVLGPHTVYLVDSQGQTLTVPNGFTYTPGVVPSFTSLFPVASSVNGGALVTLKGSSFTPETTVCVAILPTGTCTTLEGTLFIDSQTLRFTTPSGASGPVDIKVTNPNGDVLTIPKEQSLFIYSQASSPIVTSINPPSGDLAGGTAVTIAGANFAAGSTVLFDTTPATNVIVASENTITAKAPAHDKGAVSITVATPGGLTFTLLPAFTYTGNVTKVTTTTTGTATGTDTVTGIDTGTGTTTSGITTGPPTALTTDQIILANKAVGITVTRQGADNLVAFTLPLNLPATAQGVQIFRSNSPFVLIATLDRSSTDFQSRSYLDIGAPLASNYLVTVYYAGGQGKATGTDPNDGTTGVPGFSQLGDGVHSQDADNRYLPLIGYILVGVLAVFLVVLLIVLVMRGRRPPAEPANVATAPPTEASPGVEDPMRHSINCPNCGSIFEAVGPKPLRMECPTCGKAGILR